MKDGVALVIPEVESPGRPQRQRDHRQPELLHHPDGGRPQAAPRRGQGQAGRRPARTRRRAASASRWTKELIEGATPTSPARSTSTPPFGHSIAFNCIPQIGSEKEEGYTSEEMEDGVHETRKILGDKSIQVCPTAVRVPWSRTAAAKSSTSSSAVRVASVEEGPQALAAFPGDHGHRRSGPLPVSAAVDLLKASDEVFVGRIRRDLSHPNRPLSRSGA